MAEVSRSDFQDAIDEDYADGQGDGAIGAEVHRDSFNNFSDSAVFFEEVLDEDTMVSDSDNAVPTQQSLKAYTDFFGNGLKYVERTVTVAEILNIGSTSGTPVELVAAGGANVFTTLVCIILTMDYAGTPYATNTTLRIAHGTSAYGIITNYLAKTTDDMIQFMSSNQTVLANENINLYVSGANPTAGNSEVKVKLWYKTMTL